MRINTRISIRASRNVDITPYISPITLDWNLNSHQEDEHAYASEDICNVYITEAKTAYQLHCGERRVTTGHLRPTTYHQIEL